MIPLADARAVADAVLYEGYLLYPYRASAPKNQVRWQWGVLMPPEAVAIDDSERAAIRADLVIDGTAAQADVVVRFLHVVERRIHDADGREVDRLETPDATYVPFDEATEREVVLTVPLDAAFSGGFEIAGEQWTEPIPGGRGTLVRTCRPLSLEVSTEARTPEAPCPVTVLTILVQNTSTGHLGADRPAWLRQALVACHLLVTAEDARFLSMTDPPQWASGIVAECASDGVYCILADPDDRIVLASPIVLPDHAELAAESTSNFFDGLEIDELLNLRTMTLTDEEKRQMRGTDPRAAALLDEVEGLPPELMDRLHGALRQFGTGQVDRPARPDAASLASAPAEAPWWDPGADASVDPETDSITIAGVDVARGSRVVLRPGARSTDAQDLFLAGRTATIAAVLHDVDGKQHLAVTVDDDPGSDLMLAHGRYLYFDPTEVEPISQEVSH